jgi:hypothetical protein
LQSLLFFNLYRYTEDGAHAALPLEGARAALRLSAQLQVGLSLLAVRLVTWTLAVINWCFDCKIT